MFEHKAIIERTDKGYRSGEWFHPAAHIRCEWECFDNPPRFYRTFKWSESDEPTLFPLDDPIHGLVHEDIDLAIEQDRIREQDISDKLHEDFVDKQMGVGNEE